MRKIQLFIKRAFDITVSLIMIILLTVIPVLIVVPIVIKLTSKGPAVFKQERVGRNGKVFKIYKFRTMRIPEDALDENGEPLPPKKRITKVGKFLRKTSLDELMQFFNVFKGDMTLVGPRPPLPREVQFYTDYQRLRLLVTPGITCTWQISKNRNDIPFEQWVEMDIEYIQTRTYINDLKIMLKTPIVMLTATGR